MEMNLKMRRLCKDMWHDDRPVPLARELRQLLDAGFTRVADCVLLTSQMALTRSVSPDDFPDRTGYECFVNHLHLEEYFGDSIDQLELATQGVAFARRLKEELDSFAAGERFMVILAISEVECNVRFHKMRHGEEWVAPDLDKYPEAILALS